MSLNRSALKRPNKSAIEELTKKFQDANKGNQPRQKDDRFWQPQPDAAGNSSSIIRYLPAKTEDDTPFVKVYHHAFQENGSWFIEKCPTTLGLECPVCKENKRLYNTGNESDKKIAQSRNRSLKYISNVLVIRDQTTPENEGQIKLFRYGKSIFDKIGECFNADADLGEEAFDPFGFFDGANFNLKTKIKDKYLNYDTSKFVKVGDLHDGDEEKLMQVLESMFDLNEFLDPKEFKSYEELEERFQKVVNGVVTRRGNVKVEEDDDDAQFEQAPKGGVKEKFTSDDDDQDPPFEPDNKKPAKETKPTPPASSGDDDDDDLTFFKNLVKPE